MLDIVKRRYWYFGLSLLIIVPGLIALILWGLPLAIDFTGGSLVEMRFDQPTQAVTAEAITAAYTAHDFPDTIIQNSADNVFVVRSRTLDADTQAGILADLQAQFGPVTVLTAETVGPSVGAEIAQSAALAVGAAAVGVLLYIAYAFRGAGAQHAFRYGVAAIIAMLHDVLVVVGSAAIFGKVFGWEVDALFLTALLTVVGFSVHDTIVVFDRIRENLVVYRRLDYETVVNHSIVQTLDRSINTQLTVMFTLLALTLFGGVTIRHFVLTLLIGVLSGTYSSIFNAAQLLVVWENREWNTWFRRKPARPAAA
ncbi:MAG: protein translocase subunit SecF [Anaerolineales bacterium]|nr:protein translocase subunit SecF [Anaerolineales bacterium]